MGGPNGANIQCFATSPNGTGGANIYAGTDSGHVYLTANNGADWTLLGSTGISINVLATYDTNLYAGTEGRGLLRSTDNGASWVRIDSGVFDNYVHALALIPNASGGMNLLAGWNGAYLSTNQGTSWTTISSTFDQSYIQEFTVGSDSGGRTILYAGTTIGVFRSLDSGVNWTNLPGPGGNVLSLLVVADSAGGTDLFAGLQEGRIFRSTDAGTSWSYSICGQLDVTALASSHDGPGGTTLIAGLIGLGGFVSNDTGKSWAAAESGLTDYLIKTLVAFPNGSGGTNLFAGTLGGGVYLSTNNGTSWTASSSGMVDIEVCVLAVAPNGSGGTNLFAGTSDVLYSTVFLSTDDGTSWSNTGMGAGLGIFGDRVYAMATIPNGSGGATLFVGTGSGVFRTTDNGASWSHVFDNVVFSLAYAPNGTGGINLIAGTNTDIDLSTDNGSSWEEVSGYGADALVASPNRSGGTNLLAGTGEGLLLSTDDGMTWAVINKSFGASNEWSDGAGPFAVVPDDFGGSNVIAAVAYQGIYLTTNSGESWAQYNGGAAGVTNPTVNAFAVTTDAEGGFNLVAATPGGTFLSTSGVAGWTPLNSGLPGRTTIKALAVAGTNLFAGTVGGGVWRYAMEPSSSVVDAGWNLVSVPSDVPDFRKSAVYPHSSSVAYAYESGYRRADTLRNGVGYWVDFDSAQTVVYTGAGISQESVSVSPGWNVIGSIGTIVADTNIVSSPSGMTTSPFYSFSGEYFASNNIYPGRAYWVKVDEPGQLILNASVKAAPKTAIKIRPTGEMPPLPPTEKGVVKKLVPKQFALAQNYPNPFNPVTTIRYDLPKESFVHLSIFNILGQEMRTVVNETEQAGYKSVSFDGSDLASGMYFYRITAGSFMDVKKLILLK
jgi:photosystem II stability/assembly factor-like uncharacterized protein